MSDAYKELERVAADLGITLDYQFVPQRFDGTTKAHDMSLKWKVTVRKDGKAVLTTDYTQGVAHCESYPKSGRLTLHDYEKVQSECLHGPKSGQPKQPLDALHCIAMDCQGVDRARGFEEWASEYGYDTDSRKAEAIFQECTRQWMALRSFIGDEGIERLAAVEL